MARLSLNSIAALFIILAVSTFNRPATALTSASHANVGVIMVWRDANNPLGLPGGLATYVTGVLIEPQTILTAGTPRHELRAYQLLDSCRPGFGSLPASRQMRSTNPAGSNSIVHSAHALLTRRFRGLVRPRAARSTTSTASMSLE